MQVTLIVMGVEGEADPRDILLSRGILFRDGSGVTVSHCSTTPLSACSLETILEELEHRAKKDEVSIVTGPKAVVLVDAYPKQKPDAEVLHLLPQRVMRITDGDYEVAVSVRKIWGRH